MGVRRLMGRLRLDHRRYLRWARQRSRRRSHAFRLFDALANGDGFDCHRELPRVADRLKRL